MKALCFGSLNIDYTYHVDHFVKKGETMSSDSLRVFSGGKGLNQSIALAKAGVETYHAGSLRNQPMERAMDIAARAASLAVTRPGAAESIPVHSEVEQSEQRLVRL